MEKACQRRRCLGVKACPLVYLVIGFSLAPTVVLGSPGPDTVMIVANHQVEGSVALAERYAAARDIHQRRICTVGAGSAPEISLAHLERDVLIPLRACIEGLGGFDLLEAMVLVRGMPFNVGIPVQGRSMVVSLAALLGVLPARDLNGAPFIGQEPGFQTMCGGSPCLTARWLNPYTRGAFEAGWSRDRHDGRWQLLLVTALDGYTDQDAFGLVESALVAERDGPGGAFILMDGGDPARSARDFELDGVAMELNTLGVEAHRLPFDPDLTDRYIAALVTGAVSLGEIIEGNHYQPGSIIDNLTSFGAVPANFMAEGEVQTSVARWVSLGVAGVHGTTAEPLSNSFPHRRFLIDYVSGYSLAESYFKNLPYVYWRNLVLGDPIAAPYGVRPVVEWLVDGEIFPGFFRLRIRTNDPLSRSLSAVKFSVNGVNDADLDLGDGEVCFRKSERTTTLLATVRIQPEPKTVGWRRVDLPMETEPTACPPQPDPAMIDAMHPQTEDSGMPDVTRPIGDLGHGDSGLAIELSEAPPARSGCSMMLRQSSDHTGSLTLWIMLLWVYWAKKRGRFARHPPA